MNTRRFLLGAGTLLHREVVRFFRQKSRVIGALVTPLMFWFFLGVGVGRSFQTPGGAMEGLTYLQYFLPGAMVLVALFTAVFSTFSIIEDRQAGFLQAVMVSPCPRGAIVAGSIAGGTLLAFVQASVFILFLPLAGVPLTVWGVFTASAMLVLVSLGLTGLGFLLAWKTESSQAFHALMNLILLPIWFLSGAVFPLEGAPAWLRVLMKLNPATYAVSALHQSFFGVSTGPSLALCFFVNSLFAVITFIACWRLLKK